MPSGAKKRKAAKKKKGTHPNNSPNPSIASSHEGGDVKHQDDRQSDIGEASSTASQDPSHHDLLTEGEEEKNGNRDAPSNPPPADGDNKHDVVVERNAPSAEREFKIEDGFSGKFERDETERKSYDGGSSGSSSSRSSSDDESHGVKSSRVAVDAAQVSAKVDHSLHEGKVEPEPTITVLEASEVFVDCEPTVVAGEGVEGDKDSPAKSSTVEENEEKKGAVEEQVGISIENNGANSDLKTCATEETDERLSLSYNAPIAAQDLERDFEVTEPLLVPPPGPAQTTSWKGCCGLFELFTGSNR